MKTEYLMNVIGEAEDQYIESAQETRGKKRRRSPLSFVSKIALVAAIILSLATTAFASEILDIRTLLTLGPDAYYTSIQDLDRAMEKAGFQLDAKAAFRSGYNLEDINVYTSHGLDADKNELMSYKNIHVSYKNSAGHRIVLTAHQDNADLPQTVMQKIESRQIGGISVEYKKSNYKLYSEEGPLSEEDKLWVQQPGNYISYGGTGTPGEFQDHEEVQNCVMWMKGGVRYCIMDMDVETELEPIDVLFSMAEELINKR